MLSKANLKACGAPMRRMVSVRNAANLCRNCDRHSFVSAAARSSISLRSPNQVIQRTEGEDNYYAKQMAGPTAARVLPYALLAEQAYDPSVYATHRMAPRAAGCISDDPKDCDALQNSKRVAAWLNQWRYVWSCDGPDACKVRTPGQSEPVGGLGVQVWARKGARCPEAVVAFRGTVGGNKGDWESNFHWILRAFPIYDQYDQVRDHVGDFIGHIERDKCYRRVQRKSPRSGTPSAVDLPSSRPTPIREYGGSTPSIPRWSLATIQSIRSTATKT